MLCHDERAAEACVGAVRLSEEGKAASMRAAEGRREGRPWLFGFTEEERGAWEALRV